MAEIYNMTNVSNSGNIIELTQSVNQLTGELFGFMVLIAFFVILFASFRNQPVSVRFTSAAFLTTIVSFIFRVVDMTGDLVVTSFVLLTAVSFVVLFYERER
jgi:hypothetical protein